VHALVFLAQVEGPVLAEVAAGDEGAELEDGFCAGQTPPRACDIHSVLDEPSACAFDDPCGDNLLPLIILLIWCVLAAFAVAIFLSH
jgi:hypothetical protein